MTNEKELIIVDGQIFELKSTIFELIMNIITRIDNIADNYDDSGDLDGERLVNLLEDLQALAEGIDIIKNQYPDIDLSELREKLDLMERAMEVQDTMLLIDIIKFELKSLLEYWAKNLE